MNLRNSLAFSIIFCCQFYICSAQEKLVKVGGHQVNVLVKNLKNRKPGQPVLVFENGMGVGLGSWRTVIDELSKTAAVLAYDRQGEGNSEKIYELPTPKHIAGRLHALLKQLHIAPPYVLVGHSMGGVYVRAFAGHYPSEVAAMVFVDPADFTETKEDWNQIFKTIGVPENKLDQVSPQRYNVTSKPDSARYGPWSERHVLAQLRWTDFAEINSLPVPQVPILFFIGGKFEVPVAQQSKVYDHKRFFEVRTNVNIERWKKFIYSSSKGGSLVYLSNSGHFVQNDDARLVTGNIKLLLERLVTN
ncbi:alpha/beta fold hydrolase [Dyadobacter aurulentus]|uniref:alpha/beta fold hydrolase n=1 Tax=Dyadobacter sp. UC 10 TaxID=2605428 RepID=UPI0011F342F8|nr:alpha/beta hydrolase [Dyadobacter sp. UC 10]KAA0992962.1 alpha/beta hydrolase [Dyadobacter sp. UC 10]